MKIHEFLYEHATPAEQRMLNGSAVHGWSGYPQPLNRLQHAFRCSYNAAPDLPPRSEQEAEEAALEWLQTAIAFPPYGCENLIKRVRSLLAE